MLVLACRCEEQDPMVFYQHVGIFFEQAACVSTLCKNVQMLKVKVIWKFEQNMPSLHRGPKDFLEPSSTKINLNMMPEVRVQFHDGTHRNSMNLLENDEKTPLLLNTLLPLTESGLFCSSLDDLCLTSIELDLQCASNLKNSTSGDVKIRAEEKETSRSSKCRFFLRSFKTSFLFGVVVICAVLFASRPDQDRPWTLFSLTSSQEYPLNLSDARSARLLKLSIRGPFEENAGRRNKGFLSVRVIQQGGEQDGGNRLSILGLYNWTIDTNPSRQRVEHEMRTLDIETVSSGRTSIYVKVFAPRNRFVQLGISHHFEYTTVEGKVAIASVILLGVYILIITEVVHRALAAMLGSLCALAALTAVGDKPSLTSVIGWVDWETLALLFGMMIMVAVFSETGFFEWCAVMACRLSKGRVWTMIILLCLFAAIFSAFLDNVTTMLLFTPVTIRLCEVLNLEPRYILIAEVLFTNIGGAATAVGDPPNVIIVSNRHLKRRGIDFAGFTLHMSVGVAAVLLVAIPFLRLLLRKTNVYNREPSSIVELRHEIQVWKMAAQKISPASREETTVKCLLVQKVLSLEHLLQNSLKLYERQLSQEAPNWQASIQELQKRHQITDKFLLAKCFFVIASVTAVFFLSPFFPGVHLDLGWTAIIGAIWLLVLADVQDFEVILHRIEWSTLLFFASLFVLMEALAHLELINYIVEQTAALIKVVPPEHRFTVALILVLWVASLVSSLVDNIPFTTTMIPVISSLSQDKDLSLPLQPLVWALALGACLGGNGTLIGASANVVCAGIAERHGYGFSFLQFFKLGFPMLLVSTTTAMIYLLVAYSVLGWDV
uniref:P protein isoform X2 n=2 Tax=Myxine glutinosa TaxID=7769 RepID=UPI00358FEFAA